MDAKVEDDSANHIENWFLELPCLKDVKVCQCLRGPQPVKFKEVVTLLMPRSSHMELAVSYLRSEYEGGLVTTRVTLEAE